MWWLNFTNIDVPTQHTGVSPAPVSFRATTTCPDVRIWIVAALIVGIVVGRAWEK